MKLTEFLLDHGREHPVSFHMPGHKGADIYRRYGYGDFLDRIMDCDITEIPGADNLFQAETVIADVMNRYERLYGVEDSYLLVNGSSGGLIASILAAVPRGGKIVMARNCHKSVFNALTLGDISPVYAYPDKLHEFGISGQVTAAEIKRCLDEHPDAAAVILPSPNYYGICSHIKAIAEVAHEREKVLIVDQAHGAHLACFAKYLPAGSGLEFPEPAEMQGADVVINSAHKTLASFTQSAILNVCTQRVDRYALTDRLQAVESSSPSYLLMASLDINADLLENHGAELMESWADDLQWFYDTAVKEVPELRLMVHPGLDPTKLNLDMSAYGIDGNRLERLLMEQNIFVELTTGNLAMAMSGIGNRRWDYERLVEALRDISDQERKSVTEHPCIPPPKEKLKMDRVPVWKERIPLAEAEGRVCAQAVIPYPPGIPAVCPGEVFNRDVVQYVVGLRQAGQKVIGLDEKGWVTVGRL
ncbi:MAG: hypothetical protein HFE73_01580 [Firmicutes bacterium]|nr:hypothetical protein [Bacillota bacterium]